MEKMATYIGTKYGDEAAQEWIGGKKITPTEPVHSQAIKDRHAARVKATKDRIELKLRGLRVEKRMPSRMRLTIVPTMIGLCSRS